MRLALYIGMKTTDPRLSIFHLAAGGLWIPPVEESDHPTPMVELEIPLFEEIDPNNPTETDTEETPRGVWTVDI